MNERQEQFIEDSMIGDEFASAVSAHDIELESPLVGEEGLARLAALEAERVEQKKVAAFIDEAMAKGPTSAPGSRYSTTPIDDSAP